MFNRIGKYMNKTYNTKYMALYFFIFMIILESIIIGIMGYQKRYLYGLPDDEYKATGISHKCYEKKNVGKVCLIEKKVMWYERTDIEGVIKK